MLDACHTRLNVVRSGLGVGGGGGGRGTQCGLKDGHFKFREYLVRPTVLRHLEPEAGRCSTVRCIILLASAILARSAQQNIPSTWARAHTTLPSRQ